MGGFLGFKDSASVTEIKLERKDFNIGNTIKIELDMQNKECKKPIEYYEVKLECHCKYSAGSHHS